MYYIELSVAEDLDGGSAVKCTVLQIRGQVLLRLERDVVDRQSGSGVAGGTGGDGDVPRQIEAGVGGERDRKRVADAGSSSRDGGVAVVVGVGSERGLEFVAGGGPVNAVSRGVELNGEAGGIGSVAVFLDVVAHPVPRSRYTPERQSDP